MKIVFEFVNKLRHIRYVFTFENFISLLFISFYLLDLTLDIYTRLQKKIFFIIFFKLFKSSYEAFCF